jgi:hypothetical protein
MQRRRTHTDEIERCDSPQGDTIMNRIQHPFTISNYGRTGAVLFASVLALAGFANAAAMSSGHSHKEKKGTMTITTPVDVGGITLQPGDYEVKEVDSPSGPVVEFVHVFEDFTVMDSGRPLYDREVVGQVKVTEQVLSSLPKHTQLQLAPNTADPIALQIRGNEVEYMFASPQSNGKADAMASPANAN